MLRALVPLVPVEVEQSPRRELTALPRISRSLPISRGKAVGTRDYDGSMGLALVVGPAKAGKIARLLEEYLEVIERDPVLIVPGRADVERIERDLLARCGALLAGSIGTFDDVFRELALGGEGARPVLERRAARARRAPRPRLHCAQRARPLRPLRRLRRLAPRRPLRARVGPARARSARRRPRAPLRRLSRRARPARALGPRPAPPPRRRAAADRPRRLGRPSCLRVRLRGPDRAPSGGSSRRSPPARS